MSKSEARRLAKKPWQKWEHRDIPVEHQLRPKLTNVVEKWRRECSLNNRYSVQVSDYSSAWGNIVHLWIRRHDGAMPNSWSDMQRVKNELIGLDRVAVEIFPPQDDLVDQANMAHIWVLPEDFVLPFTL